MTTCSQPTRRQPQRGFTLLEVILAITILSTLSILTTQAISRALKARTKIQAEVDDVSALRDAMRMLRTDINLAFHHLDFEKEMVDLANKPANPRTPQQPQGQNPGVPPPPPQQPQTPQQPPRRTKRYDPVTNFIGSDTELNFVTMNTGRLAANTPQADFVEVGYSLKSCNNLSTGTASQCLFRRTHHLVDEDVKTGGNEIVMLENVTEFKLRYIGEGKQDWVNLWDSSNASPDAGTKTRFPDAVEVSITIQREIENKPKNYSLQLVVPVHFPNNPTTRSNAAATGGNTGSQQNPQDDGGGPDAP